MSRRVSLIDASARAVQRMEQLAEMVNHYAARLNLGHKVYAEDWTKELRGAIAAARTVPVEG